MGNSLLDPVEGVTLEQWASVNAKIVAGTLTEDAIKAIGADAPKWDRVNNEWLTRMRNDTSFTISKIYAAAFNASPAPAAAAAATGDSAPFSPESYPFEKWIEAMVAQDVLGKQGRDAQDILKDFGLTVGDYSKVSGFWNGKMMTDFSYAMKMQTLMNEYKAKYESMGPGNAHTDIDF
jgi:hypothetical protein